MAVGCSPRDTETQWMLPAPAAVLIFLFTHYLSLLSCNLHPQKGCPFSSVFGSENTCEISSPHLSNLTVSPPPSDLLLWILNVMAHPLTQHPPSALPFTSASRPSPLGFGFGCTTSISAFGLQATQFGGNAGLPSAFMTSPNGTSSLARRNLVAPLATSTPSDHKQVYLKRQRRSSSSSPSSSPSPPSLSRPSPLLDTRDLAKGKDKVELSVGTLALDNASSRTVPVRKQVKRSRREDEVDESSPASASQIDIGVLLGTPISDINISADKSSLIATLPASAHLPILLSVLSRNPDIGPSIMPQIPQPDLSECLKELERSVTRTHRANGMSIAGYNQARSWTRSQKDIEAFCRMVSVPFYHICLPWELTVCLGVDLPALLQFTTCINPTSSRPPNQVLPPARTDRPRLLYSTDGRDLVGGTCHQ